MRIRYSVEQVEKGEKTEKHGKPVKKACVYTQDEHGIRFADVDAEAVTIVERLRREGFETYIVGGAVRDLILGKKPKDFDIVSQASPAKIKRIFHNSRIIGHRFRLVHVYFREKLFEVSTFRSLKDGFDTNTFGTIEEDVRRRDFSINALFYDPLKQVVVDYVGGMEDMHKRNLRPLIPLTRIFIDDPVRMIRAVKYSTTTGFKLSLSLRWLIKKQASLLGSVSPSRLTEEILKIIHSPCAAEIVENLDAAGLYAYLQPEAARLMKRNKDFKERYLSGLARLSGAVPAPDESLAPLIRDYLEIEKQIQWNPDPEQYKTVFVDLRQFLFPLSPPKIELDQSLRFVFREHGVVMKKMRLFERDKKSKVSENTGTAGKNARGKTVSPKTAGETAQRKTENTGENTEIQETAPEEKKEKTAAKTRRRRPRKRKPDPT